MDLKLYEYDTPWGVHIKAYGREGTNDENTLISCLAQDEYEIRQLPEMARGAVTIDLGAHIGGVSLALASRGFPVYAVEMLPENVEILKKNLEINGFSHLVEVFPFGVSGKAGIATAKYANTETEAGRVHEFIGTLTPDKTPANALPGGREIKVNTITLASLLENEYQCDFLKVDIEGEEWSIFENTPAKLLNKVKAIAIELEGLDQVVSTDQFLKLLPEGFEDKSKEFFPKWSDPSTIVHGYYINKKLL